MSWAIGFAILIAYAQTLSWTNQRARHEGVFLVHEILDQEPDANRVSRLHELQPHFGVDLGIVSLAEVERFVGRHVKRGERIPHRVSPREEWYYLVFNNGQSALAAGPVNPFSPPQGFFPIGVIIAIIGLPLIAGLVALRVEYQLRKVESANKALAAGELTIRVDDQGSPSNELAASFNEMAERVERLIRSRDELVQAVSHELGSPLSRLRFQMELLANQSEEKREERLQAMTLELDALDDLVAELLSYVQSDEIEIDRRTFDPTQSLTDLTELAELEAPEGRNVEVKLELPVTASIHADQRLFQRAIENLLRNAVRHARNRVWLELKEENEQVSVAIHDDGPGIPEELREKVLAPFVRLNADRGRRTGGVGLGLAIVSRIMQRHGGHLAISDSPLGGAMVETVWPFAK